jgi:hypothetical protein
MATKLSAIFIGTKLGIWFWKNGFAMFFSIRLLVERLGCLRIFAMLYKIID